MGIECYNLYILFHRKESETNIKIKKRTRGCECDDVQRG